MTEDKPPRSARLAPVTEPLRRDIREIIDFEVFFEGDSRTQQQREEEIKRLRSCWDIELPHFGGSSPHRYDSSWPYCTYCGRPLDYATAPARYDPAELARRNMAKALLHRIFLSERYDVPAVQILGQLKLELKRFIPEEEPDVEP